MKIANDGFIRFVTLSGNERTMWARHIKLINENGKFYVKLAIYSPPAFLEINRETYHNILIELEQSKARIEQISA